MAVQQSDRTGTRTGSATARARVYASTVVSMSPVVLSRLVRQQGRQQASNLSGRHAPAANAAFPLSLSSSACLRSESSRDDRLWPPASEPMAGGEGAAKFADVDIAWAPRQSACVSQLRAQNSTRASWPLRERHRSPGEQLVKLRVVVLLSLLPGVRRAA